MRHLVIAAAFLVFAVPAGATDVWDKVLPGKPPGADLTPDQTAKYARALCRCLPEQCTNIIRSGEATETSPLPLSRLLAAALEGRGISALDARALFVNEQYCSR